jgi:hypothetical protein
VLVYCGPAILIRGDAPPCIQAEIEAGIMSQQDMKVNEQKEFW